MKITKIEKKNRLYLLEIDEKDELYVTEDTIVHFMLSKNMEFKDTPNFHMVKTWHFTKFLSSNVPQTKSKNT